MFLVSSERHKLKGKTKKYLRTHMKQFAEHGDALANKNYQEKINYKNYKVLRFSTFSTSTHAMFYSEDDH